MPLTGRLPIAILVLGLPVFAGTVSGIKNFDKVDEHVYRGGQPTDDGFRYLARMGVKTVLDLREGGERARAEECVVKAAGMAYVNIPMGGLTPPTEEQISKILALLEETAPGAVFVHCQRGADRTGVVIAAYHIDHDKWDNARALADANAHHMSFFQFPRKSYIRNFRARKAPLSAPVAVAVPAGKD